MKPSYPIKVFTNDENVFCMNIFFPVGSIYETSDVHGISHFLEHMKFKRSHTFTGNEILNMLESKGTVYNAYTTKDHTCYYIRTLDEHFVTGLRMLCEISFNTQFSRNDIDTERKVVIEELYKTADKSGIWDHAERAVLAKSNPYSKSVIGKRSTLMSIDNRTLLHFHKEHYLEQYYIVVNCPERKVRAITELLHTTLERLGVHPPVMSNSIVNVRPLPNTNKMEYNISLNYVPSNQYGTMITFATFPRSDPRSHIVEVLSHMLSYGLLSVLGREIREKRGLVYSISTENNQYRHLGMFHISFSTSSPKTHHILEVIFDTIFDLERKLTARRWNKIKQAYLDYLEYQSKQTSFMVDFLGKESFYNPSFTYSKFIRQIQKMTLTKALRTLYEVVDPNKMGMVSFGAYPNIDKTLDKLEKIIKIAKTTHKRIVG